METDQRNYRLLRTSRLLLERERDAVLSSIDIKDNVVYIAQQKRSSGAVVVPSLILTTTKKVIIVERHITGLKSNILVMPYKSILSVRVSHGMSFSSILIKLKGSFKHVQGSMFVGGEDGIIHGLTRSDANVIFTQLGRMIHKPENEFMPDHNYELQSSGNDHLQIHQDQYNTAKNPAHYDAQNTSLVVPNVIGNEMLQLQSHVSEKPSNSGNLPALQTTTYIGTSINNGEEGRLMLNPELNVAKESKTLKPDDLIIFKIRKQHIDLSAPQE